jgi:[ribosomal protein S5]-alanine N-acetyltransferase
VGEALKVTLETARLRLRPFDESDFEAVHSYAREPQVCRFQSWGPNSEEDTRAFLARAVACATDEHSRDFEFAVVERQSECVIGGCGLHPRRVELWEYEIGWTLNPEFWRRGFGSEAARAVVEFAFRDLSAHRLYALIDPENTASIQLAERLGFHREGHQRQDRLVRGDWRDSLVFGLIKSDGGHAQASRAAP